MEKTYFTYLAILGLFLAFGFYNPLYWLVCRLPLYKSLKWPGRHLILTNFALCVLAGYGYAKYPNPWVIVITLIDLFWYGSRFLYLRRESDFYPPQAIMDYLMKKPGKILTLSVKDNKTDWEPGILEFPANATIPMNIVNITGYDPFIVKEYHDLTNKLQGLEGYGQTTIKLDNVNKELLDTLKVDYIFAPKDKNFEGFKPVVETKKGVLLERILR